MNAALVEDYFRYTVCDRIPAGRKRLRFIVGSIEAFRGETPRNKIRVLDYGCGNGYLTIALASLGYEIDGVDIDQPSILFAKDKNPFDNARFYHIENGQINTPHILSAKLYDVVVSSEVLHWTRDPAEHLRSAGRSLKGNGIFIITDENAFGPREVLGRLERFLLRSSMIKCAIKYVRDKFGMSSAENRYELYSANPDIIGRQEVVRHNFSIYSIRRLFLEHGFEIFKQRNSFFLFAVFGLGGEARLDEWDCRLADYLPTVMASGWYFILKIAERPVI